jgi:proteasome lid subunit RPN8/RPN11
MGMKLEISSCVIRLIQSAATEAAPKEACGLLFGSDGRIGRASTVANVAPDRRRNFEIDPAALFAALRRERAGTERLAGYWHSHPGGDTTPSVTDAAMAAPDGRVWLIEARGQIAVWRAVESGAVHGRFDPLDWTPRG